MNNANQNQASLFSTFVDNAASPVRPLFYVGFGAIGGLLLLTAAMWGLNQNGYTVGVGIVLVLGLILVKWLGFQPTVLVSAAFFGGLINRAQGGSVVRGASTGANLLYRAVMAICLGYLMVGLFLLVVPVVHSPGAFWVGVAVLYGALVAGEVSGLSWPGKWKVINLYFLLMGVGALLQLVNAPGFDPETGEPTHMGYYVTKNDGSTIFLRELGKTPKDCRPNGVPHQGFSYATQGTCFSSKTGVRLVPEPVEHAIGRAADIQGTSILGKVSTWVSDKFASCPSHKILVNVGDEFTMTKGCERIVVVPEKYRDLTRPALRIDVAEAGLVRKDNHFFETSWEGAEKGEVRLIPNRRAFEAAGRDEVRFVVSYNLDGSALK